MLWTTKTARLSSLQLFTLDKETYMLSELDRTLIRLAATLAALEHALAQKSKELTEQKQFYENQIAVYKSKVEMTSDPKE